MTLPAAVQGLPLDILQAAAECFMERGFHATSIDDVAHRLGATKGRIYHYYRAKIDLFFDIHRVGMACLFEAVEPARAAPGTGAQVLAAMLHAHALALFEHHAFETVVVQGVQLHRFGALTNTQRSQLDGLIASRDRFEALFKDQVEAAKADGSVDAALDTSITVKTLLGGLQWSLIWYRPRLDAPAGARQQLADAMVRTLVKGVEQR